MFPIKCKDLLPVDHLVIKSVAVRGRLGPLTVWVSNKDANYDRDRRYRTLNSLARHAGVPPPRHDHINDEGEHRVPLKPSSWTKLHEKVHKPCPRGNYTELVFNEPVCLRPGEMRALYIHSTLPGDQAIVYDNSYYGSSDKRYEDDKLCILTGRAHVSTICFGQDPIWGWGNAWRDRREFVGRLAYGTVYKLWNPEVQPKFGNRFQNGARTLFLCQRRWESNMSKLPDEAIFYILNMCRWDWFDDCQQSMKDRRKREKARIQSLSGQQMEKEEEEERKPAAAATGCSSNGDEKMGAKPAANEATPARCAFSRSAASAGGKTTGLNEEEEDEDEEYVETSDDSVDADTEMQDDGDDDEEEDEEIVMTDAEGVDIESEESSEDEDDYHRATRRYFGFQYPDSDEEEEEEEMTADSNTLRNDWFRHQFARVHVLRALSAMEDQAIND